MALTGLGNKIRRLFKDVWDATFGEVRDFAEQEVPPLAKKIYSLLSDFSEVESDAIGAVIDQLADNPRGAISAGATAALVPTPFTPLVLGMLVSGAMGTALQFALLDQQTAKSWEAQKKILPDQVKAQTLEQLKYAVDQAVAQWEAQKTILPEQVRLQTLEGIKYVKDQLRAQVEANIEVRPTPMPTAPLFSAWFRGIINEDQVTEMLRFGGLQDDYIEVLKREAEFYPPPSDLISFISREAFEPEMVEKYDLDNGFDTLDLDPLRKGGLTDEISRLYWRAHWQHAAETRIIEMFRRDILSDPADREGLIVGSPEWHQVRAKAEDWYFQWFGLVEMAPVWRKRLIATAYEPLTRTDAQRMWYLGILDDNALMRVLADQGYDADNCLRYLTWIKVEKMLPSIQDRYRNLWIGPGEVMDELLATGVDPAIARRIFETVIVNLDAPLRVARERDLTKADIIKAYKTETIEFDQAVELLVDIGYDENEAELVLIINPRPEPKEGEDA